MSLELGSYLLGKKAGGGSGGTTNYADLTNKPQINSVELSGNKTLANLGIQSEISSTNKLDASLVDDSLSNNKFVTSAEKTTWNGKQDLLTAGANITIDANNVISATGGGSGESDLLVYDLTNSSYKPNFRSRTTKNDSTTLNDYVDVLNDIIERYNNNKKQALILFKWGDGYLSKTDCYNNVLFMIDSILTNNIFLKGVNLLYDNGNGRIPSMILKYENLSLTSIIFDYIPVTFLMADNEVNYSVTNNANPAHKKYVDNKPTTYAGYDATKTQVLKNVNGTLTWVDE